MLRVEFKTQSLRAQTILELFGVLFLITFIFGSGYIFLTMFEVGQKQTMLVRSQAFLELGNYSDYGLGPHGQDVIADGQGAVVFQLGQNHPGTRVNLDEVGSFKSAVEGQMEINAGRITSSQKYWQLYGFPRARVQYKWQTNAADSILSPTYLMTQTAAIVNNRSLKLDADIFNSTPINTFGGGTGMYSGGLHYMQWQAFAQAHTNIPGVGLIDNTAFIDEQLKAIVQNDPSLAQEADNFRGRVSAMDGLTGGAEVAIITAALTLAFNFGLPALENALGGAAGAGGAAGGAVNTSNNVLNNIINGLGGGGGLIEGAHLYNTSQILYTVSNGLTLVDLGFSIAGENVEGLKIAAGVTGAAAGITGGLSTFQKFNGFQYGGENVLGQAGLYSDIFKGTSQITGGLGTLGGYVDPTLGQTLGYVSMGTGFAGSAVSFGENYSGITNVWRDSSGAWKDGKQWAAVGAAGGVIAGAGGIIGVAAPNSSAGTIISTIGGGVGLVGAGGAFAHGLSDGSISFSDKPFEFMAQAGGLVGSASGLGAGVAGLTGNEELAEKFGYGAIAGGAVALVGGVGMLAEAAGDALSKAGKKGEGADGQSVGGKSDSEARQDQGAVEDLRTDFEKLNDAKAAVDQAIAAGNTVLGTAGTIKGAVDAYNQAKENADQLEAQALAQHQAEMNAINAQNQAQQGFQQAREPSGVAASSLESTSAVAVMRQMESLDRTGIRAQLSEDTKQRFDHYLEMIDAAEAHIREAQRNNRPPDQAIVHNMLEAYQNVQRIVVMQQSYQQMMAQEENLEVGDVTNRALARVGPMGERFTRAVAGQIERQGKSGFQRGLDQRVKSNQKLGDLSELRASFKELSRANLAAMFGPKDAPTIREALLLAEEAIGHLQSRLESKRLPDPVMMAVAQKEIDRAQEIVNRKVKTTPLLAQRKLIEDAHKFYLAQSEGAKKVEELVQISEKYLGERPVIAKNMSDRMRFQKLAKQSAEKIAKFRSQFFPEDSPEARRLEIAERKWRRVKFVSPREAFDQLVAQVEDRSTRYVQMKTRLMGAMEERSNRVVVWQ